MHTSTPAPVTNAPTAPPAATTVAAPSSVIDYFPTRPAVTTAGTDVATTEPPSTVPPATPPSTVTVAPTSPVTTHIAAAATPAVPWQPLDNGESDGPPIFAIVIVVCTCMIVVAVAVVCCRARWAKKRREAKVAANEKEAEDMDERQQQQQQQQQDSAYGDDETIAFDNGSFEVRSQGMQSLNGTERGSDGRSGPIARRKSGRRFLPPPKSANAAPSDGDPLASTTASELPIAATASERSWMDLPMPASQADSVPWRMHPPPPPSSSKTPGSSAEDEYGALHVFSDVPSQPHAGDAAAGRFSDR